MRREEGKGAVGVLATSCVEQRKGKERKGEEGGKEGGNEDIPCARSLESRTVVIIVSISDKRKGRSGEKVRVLSE